MLLDASAGGNMGVKTDLEVQTLIENIAQNKYRAETERGKRGVFGVSENSAILVNQKLMSKQILRNFRHRYKLLYWP